MPKRANNVTMYTARLLEKATAPQTNTLHKITSLKNEGKSNMIPGHVRASINWNNLKKANSDAYSLSITDGMKVVVCKLKNNPMGYTSVAYPTDELNLPQWFKELPFDEEAMEETVLDKKIENVIGPMKYDLSRTTQSEAFTHFFEI